MQIILREENFKCNIEDLKRRGYKDYIFVHIGHKRGFIISKNMKIIEMLSQKIGFQVLLECEEKIPLYKQDMQIKMGKIPQSKKSVLRPYNVRVLEKCQDRYCYFVWSVL